jgi:hypothetical protein
MTEREFTIEGFDIPSYNHTVRMCVDLLRAMEHVSGRDLSSERLSILSLLHQEQDGDGFIATDKMIAAVSIYKEFLDGGRMT